MNIAKVKTPINLTYARGIIGLGYPNSYTKNLNRAADSTIQKILMKQTQERPLPLDAYGKAVRNYNFNFNNIKKGSKNNTTAKLLNENPFGRLETIYKMVENELKMSGKCFLSGADKQKAIKEGVRKIFESVDN